MPVNLTNRIDWPHRDEYAFPIEEVEHDDDEMVEDENEDEDNQSVNWDRDEVSPVMISYWKSNCKIVRCEMSHST
jgi:hypothetical protein